MICADGTPPLDSRPTAKASTATIERARQVAASPVRAAEIATLNRARVVTRDAAALAFAA